MSDPYIGEIMLFAGNFEPRGWAFCNGQLLSIAQNTALFSILGTTYGGNGQTTFALPDLRGRAPVHQGQGPGLSSYALGQSSGSETVTLGVNQIPAHAHPTVVLAANSAPTTNNPSGAVPAAPVNENLDPVNIYAEAGAANAALAITNGVAGGNQSHSNLQPYLAVSYVIALQGIFPSRN